MQGLIRSGDETVCVVVVESISDEFEQHLKERLAAYCYGEQQAQEDRDYYSLQRTIAEFLTRYKAKHATTQIGMAGELIVHLVMREVDSGLVSAAVFFNKEERSIKKGFDLTFHSGSTAEIWYGEVKSGEVAEGQTADQKSHELLKAAATDIAEKLGRDAQRSRWDAALIDAALTLDSPQARSAKGLLRSHATAATSGTSYAKRVVLAAAVMHDLAHCIVSDATAATAAATLKSNRQFTDLRVLVVQQHEIEAVVGILERMAADAESC